jgi:hypothetical protein
MRRRAGQVARPEGRERGVHTRRVGGGIECARDEQARPVADHRHDGFERERWEAVSDARSVARIGDVTPRVDKRPVEVEEKRSRARRV